MSRAGDVDYKSRSSVLTDLGNGYFLMTCHALIGECQQKFRWKQSYNNPRAFFAKPSVERHTVSLAAVLYLRINAPGVDNTSTSSDEPEETFGKTS